MTEETRDLANQLHRDIESTRHVVEVLEKHAITGVRVGTGGTSVVLPPHICAFLQTTVPELVSAHLEGVKREFEKL